MKLVEILVMELERWPRGINAITQDISTAVWGFSSDKAFPVCSERSFWYSPGGVDLGMREIGIDDVALSSDHATAIVTRADWESERAKLKAPKANADGWVRHRGGKCPVEAGVAVEYRMRSGMVITSQTGSLLSWDHLDCGSDIMAYRIHKPADQPALVSEEAIKPAELGKFDAVAIRDQIRELDTQREEVESTYQRQISEITQERESLVQKLAGEGLALVEVVVQPVDPDFDSGDKSTWRVGDVVEISHSDNGSWRSRKGMIGHLNYDSDFYQGGWFIKFDGAGDWAVSDNTYLKFHSRHAS